MKTSLIISTYNSVDFLNLCLKSVAKQVVMPDEVIIADDGSTSETKDLIDSFRDIISVPIVHVWHEDKGFKLATIRNKAIAKAQYEYMISIDGDLIINKHFIKDHKRHAKPNTFIIGSRAMLDKKITERLIAEQTSDFLFFAKGVKAVENAIRLPFLTKTASAILDKKYPKNYSKGGNMSCYVADIKNVNGYDEDYIGWGLEDADLTVRMLNSNMNRFFLKYCAITFHIYHDGKHRIIKDNPNVTRFQECMKMNKVRCENGIEKSL